MTDWGWHVHHNILCEPLTESMQMRRAYIRARKPANEIETRLRLLKGVRGAIPVMLIDAYDAWLAARSAAWSAASAAVAAAESAWAAAWSAAVATAESAWSAYQKAYEDAMPEINRLHLEECPDCPWDGKTIFPRGMITEAVKMSDSYHKPIRRIAFEYIILGIINSFVVYAVYTPYVIFWLHLSGDQYVRWLVGGIPFALMTSWFFAWVIVRSKK